MIRTKGEAGTGDIIEAVRHVRQVNQGIQEVVLANPFFNRSVPYFTLISVSIQDISQSSKYTFPILLTLIQ